MRNMQLAAHLRLHAYTLIPTATSVITSDGRSQPRGPRALLRAQADDVDRVRTRDGVIDVRDENPVRHRAEAHVVAQEQDRLALIGQRTDVVRDALAHPCLT